MKQVFAILGFCIALASCDCHQVVRGTVFDFATGKPIIGLEVYNKDKSRSNTITDSLGKFELSNVSGGITCPPMTVVLGSKDYKNTEVIIPSGGNMSIVLKKK